MSWRKSLFLLFCVSSTISFVVLFRITIHSHITSTPLPTIPAPHRNSCSSTNLTARKQHLRRVSQKLTCQPESHDEGAFTAKEYLLLSNLVSRKAPCNLLVFGFIPQFLGLAALNAEGTTVFLEDDEEKIKKTARESGRARAYRARYNTKAGDAYRLLKHAREHFGCKLGASPVLRETGCELALTGLPDEVYEIKWDVVVVDGPRGDHREAPGRMGAIYTAAVIAKRGNVTDVFVHDVDRMVEKWYSWEFLCQENLVSSKGNLWHFEVQGNPRFPSFCPEANIQTL